MNDYAPEQKSDQFLLDILFYIMCGVWQAFDKKTPRYHQVACLWLNIHSNKTILEVKTG
jgi:hypothetical protein